MAHIKTTFNYVLKHFIILAIVTFSISCISNEKKTYPVHNPPNSKIDTVSIYTISNMDLIVAIKSKGAELSSIKSGFKEYLWQGDEAFWKEQSPILFPIVGRLVDHEFVYRNKTYPMKFHGFAWKSDFKIIEKSSRSITFELTSSKEQKGFYPFDFNLQIKYTLKGKTLDVAYKVENPSKTEGLYFSIGAHPAFNCPMEKDQKRNDYQLVFDVDSMPKSQDKESGLYINRYTQYFKKPGVLELQDSIFNRGALVFKNNPFSKATLIHKPTEKKYLSMQFKNFPYLGIWSMTNKNDAITPFVCIEPWYGVADAKSHNKDFTQKEGIIKLQPNKTFNCNYTIQIF